MTITLTQSEITSLITFIEVNFFQDMAEADSMLYAYNILNIFKKCGGLKQFADYEEEEE